MIFIDTDIHCLFRGCGWRWIPGAVGGRDGITWCQDSWSVEQHSVHSVCMCYDISRPRRCYFNLLSHPASSTLVSFIGHFHLSDSVNDVFFGCVKKRTFYILCRCHTRHSIHIHDRDNQRSCPCSVADLIDLHCGVSSDALTTTLSRACTRNARDMTRACPCHVTGRKKWRRSDRCKKSKNSHVNSLMHCRVHFLFLEQRQHCCPMAHKRCFHRQQKWAIKKTQIAVYIIMYMYMYIIFARKQLTHSVGRWKRGLQTHRKKTGTAALWRAIANKLGWVSSKYAHSADRLVCIRSTLYLNFVAYLHKSRKTVARLQF